MFLVCVSFFGWYNDGVISSLFFIKLFLQLNFYFILLLVIISVIIYYFSKINNFQILGKNVTSLLILRPILIYGLLVSFILYSVTLIFYLWFMHNLSCIYLLDTYVVLPDSCHFLTIKFFNFFSMCVSNIYFSIDLFGLILLGLAYIIGFISIMTLDTRLFWKNIKYLFSFNIFVLIVYIYVSVSNIILFFLMYEMLLIPSFFFVYFTSPSRRSIQAALYFVIWTQVGSLLVLSVVAYILAISSCYDFIMLKNFKFTSNEVWFMYFILFIGFGIKVPIWPFHYWLTKTHVEAASGFSIYLSGFLVKTALYGFYKLSNCLCGEFDTTIYLIISLCGVIDASLKMWGQTDLKKLVAYGTIQEMNLIYATFCLGDVDSIYSGIMFCITHAFLSALMFFLVDCVYRRYHTRSLIEINGILHTTPNLGIAILTMCIFYSGLPGTMKFISEFWIFSGLIGISATMCIVLMFFANVLGLIGFSKCWFNLVFGMFKKNLLYMPLDLTWKESLISLYCFFCLFIFTYTIEFFI